MSVKVEIHTLKWSGASKVLDADVAEGRDANVTLNCRVFINDREVPQVVRARALFDGHGFSEAVLRVLGDIRVLSHTGESWKALDDHPGAHHG